MHYRLSISYQRQEFTARDLKDTKLQKGQPLSQRLATWELIYSVNVNDSDLVILRALDLELFHVCFEKPRFGAHNCA